MLFSCLFQGQHLRLWSMLYDKEKSYIQLKFFIQLCIFLSWMLIYNCEYKAWQSQEAWSHRETIRAIQQQTTRKALLSLCTAEAHVHILWGLGLGPQPKNCGCVHWMAAIFRASTVHKKQCALSELHLRKHLGTGQGPAAEGSCHWGALSHWCASVQRPCKSATKEPKIHKDT